MQTKSEAKDPHHTAAMRPSRQNELLNHFVLTKKQSVACWETMSRFLTGHETPVGRFVYFLNDTAHISSDETNSLMRLSKANSFDIASRRGQSYINDDKVSEKYNEMLAIIQQKNPTGVYVLGTIPSLSFIRQSTMSS